MPRKRRAIKARTAAPLSAAIEYRLMTGAWAEARVAGWVAAAPLAADEVAHLKAVWAAHGDTLRAEAEQFGFDPYAITHTPPTGTGFRRWAERFLRTNRY
jgi:hypothetical protein